jgi:hypothetical protein
MESADLQATRARPWNEGLRAIPAPFLIDVFSAEIKQVLLPRGLVDDLSEASPRESRTELFSTKWAREPPVGSLAHKLQRDVAT